jgi:hypothetical protein
MSRTIVNIKDRLPADAELGQELGMTVEQLEQSDRRDRRFGRSGSRRTCIEYGQPV